MKFIPTALLASSLALTAWAQLTPEQAPYYTQPKPRQCNGACINPGTTQRYQDTTVIRRPGSNGGSDLYFRFSKGDNEGDGLNVATAPALNGNWTYNFTILGSQLKSECDSSKYVSSTKLVNRWAPEIHFLNGRYVLYYTAVSHNGVCFDQCVATSPSMDANTWQDLGSVGLPTASHGEWARIDGNVVADESNPQGASAPYMTWGSYQYGIYGIQLDNTYLKVANGASPTLLIADQRMPNNQGQGGNYTEGPLQIQHNGYIYLFYSRGNCCAGAGDPENSVYVTQVCRTKSSSPQGPYLDMSGARCDGSGGVTRPGTTFLRSNNQNGKQASVWQPGSVSVINDPQFGLSMGYQFQDNTGNSPFLQWSFNPMSWRSDGWPILNA